MCAGCQDQDPHPKALVVERTLRILINTGRQTPEAAGPGQAGKGSLAGPPPGATTALSLSHLGSWGPRSGSWLHVLSCLAGGWGCPCRRGLPPTPLVRRAQSLFPRLKPSQLKSSKPRVVGATPPPSGSSHQGLLWGQVLPAAPWSLGGRAPLAVLSRPSLQGGRRFLWVQWGLGVPCVQDSQESPWDQEVQEDPWGLGALGAQPVPGASGCSSQ